MLFSSALLLSLAASASAQPTGKWFDKYMFIMLENMDLKSILANPTFSEIASKGILLDNYHGTTHPSQPNCKYLLEGALKMQAAAYLGLINLFLFCRLVCHCSRGQLSQPHLCSQHLHALSGERR